MQNSESLKGLKWQILHLLIDSPTLISRKISVTEKFLISTLSFQVNIENDLFFNFRCWNSQLANSRKIPIFTPPAAPRPSVWFPDYEVMPVSVLLGTTSHVRYRMNVHVRIFISIIPKMLFQCFQQCQEIS